MLQETINRCEKAYALIKQGEPMDKARTMMGLGVGTMYEYLRKNDPSMVAPERAGRYDAKTKKVVKRIIKEGKRQGLSYLAIAEELVKQGINTPNGATPNAAFIASQVQRYGIKTKKVSNGVVPQPPAITHAPAPKSNRLPTSILLMLEDEGLPELAKLEIILAYKKTLRGGM